MNWFKARYFLFVVVVSLIFVGIIARLFYLMVYQHDFYLDRSDKQIQKLIKIDTSRGQIFDRNMHPLAISRPVYSVYASPNKILNKQLFAKNVAPLLQMKESEIYSKINRQATFVWLKRKIDWVDEDALKQFPADQLNVLTEEKRVYPNGQLSSDILGFVGMDSGLAGLEYRFDKYLTGEQGFYIIQGDPRGVRIISSDKVLVGNVRAFERKSRVEASSLKGGNLVITIDYRIQYLVESLLEANSQRVEAESGQVIVMDVKTGDIIAMADYPFLIQINLKKSHIRY